MAPPELRPAGREVSPGRALAAPTSGLRGRAGRGSLCSEPRGPVRCSRTRCRPPESASVCPCTTASSTSNGPSDPCSPSPSTTWSSSSRTTARPTGHPRSAVTSQRGIGVSATAPTSRTSASCRTTTGWWAWPAASSSAGSESTTGWSPNTPSPAWRRSTRTPRRSRRPPSRRTGTTRADTSTRNTTDRASTRRRRIGASRACCA